MASEELVLPKMHNNEKTGSSDEEDVWFDIPDELEAYADCPGTPHIQKFLGSSQENAFPTSVSLLTISSAHDGLPLIAILLLRHIGMQCPGWSKQGDQRISTAA